MGIKPKHKYDILLHFITQLDTPMLGSKPGQSSFNPQPPCHVVIFDLRVM